MSKIIIDDLANLGAGVYKGWMNASGIDVDPMYMAYVLGSTSLIRAGLEAREFSDDFENPVVGGAVGFFYNGALGGAVEIAIGYGAGWLAQKIIF